MIACAVLIAASVATGAGAYLFDRGERFLRSGDLRGAGRAFRSAMTIDPFRSIYPDALSNIYYRGYLEERSSRTDARRIPEPFIEALRLEDRARQLAPRDLKYTLRLSRFFFELLRLRGNLSDARMSLLLADGSLRINPYGIEILWHKADILEFLGRREEAIREMEAAVSVEPNFCRGYARLADLARGADPGAATRWSRSEEECRRRAVSLIPEENEQWLVESPEDR